MMPDLTPKQGKLLFSALIILSAFFFLFRLGDQAFLDYDEATYARVAKEAMNSGEHLSFTLWGKPWIDKPPLYFWLATGSAEIFGFNELALRLPGALFGITAVIITWLFAFYLSKNYFTAFLAGAILAFSGEFAFAARQFRMDAPVTAAIIASLYFFVRGWKNGKWFLAMGASLAAGVLLKSLVGLFAAPAIIAFSLAYRKWDWLKSGYFWAGGAVFFLLAAPWHFYEASRYGNEFWKLYAGYHLFSRFGSPIIGGGVTIFHYIKYLFFLVEPWFLLFLILAAWQGARYRKKIKEYPAPMLASFLSFIFIFTIFAVSKTKLFYYLEPIYPFMAIFIALSAADLTGELKMEKKKIISVAGIILALGFFNSVWQVFNLREGFSGEYAVADEERKAGLEILTDRRLAVYSLDWYWLETLSYYGERKVNMLPEPFIGEEPFYLIVPAGLFKTYLPSKEFRQRANAVMEGKIISLYEVRAGKRAKIFKEL
jgi:4-amino-4-deoxy-L-arabinose transferase-like glycosyltransferase